MGDAPDFSPSSYQELASRMEELVELGVFSKRQTEDGVAYKLTEEFEERLPENPDEDDVKEEILKLVEKKFNLRGGDDNGKEG